jgi:hypothetical protein
MWSIGLESRAAIAPSTECYQAVHQEEDQWLGYR